MGNLKVIKTKTQYFEYCDELERLSSLPSISASQEDKIELLTVLIEKWDEEHSSNEDKHPVDMLKQLMEMHELNAAGLSKHTGIDKTVLSKILNYKKGFSKEVIRILSGFFKVSQEAFNKPYRIDAPDEKDISKLKRSSQR